MPNNNHKTTLKRMLITDLKPADYNPRKISESALKGLSVSLLKFGNVQPIVFNKKTKNVVGGHQRLKILQKQGINEVDVVEVNLTEKEEKTLNLTLNNPHITGDFTSDVEAMINDLFISDAELVSELKLDDILKDLNLYPSKAGNTDPDDVPEPKKSFVGTGDLWQLGNHRLLCGDCTKKENVERLMAGEKVDMVFTDPPYGINIVKVGGGGKTKFGKVGGGKWVKANYYMPIKNDDVEFNPDFLFQLSKQLLLFGGNYYANKLNNSGCWICWDKTGEDHIQNNFADCEYIWTNLKKPSRIFRCKWRGLLKDKGEDLKKRIHPTQKPIKLLIDILQEYSLKNESILDLFGGSGSTLIACEQLNRKCRMMEIEEYYCSIIIERWQQFTGGKAIKL